MHARTVPLLHGPGEITVNTNKKLVAAARRAAKVLARNEGLPYQKCLDLIAQKMGRPHWTSFLADPVPVDEDAVAAAAEPDFTRIDPAQHYEKSVQYGVGIGAVSMVATIRAWNDIRPILTFGMTDGQEHPVDARGLDLIAVAMAAVPNSKDMLLDTQYAGWSGRGFPTFGVNTMRSDVQVWREGDIATATTTIGLDGRDPPRFMHPHKPYVGESDLPASGRQHEPFGKRVRRILTGGQRYALKSMLSRRQIGTKDGPVIGFAGGKTLRLPPGNKLMVFSAPGTGRQAAITIPALLTDDETSYIVHDDGVHVHATSGWRATLGRVAIIHFEDETKDGINPFDASWLPQRASSLEYYVNKIMEAIAPDSPQVARLLAEAALRLIHRNGQTTLREVRTELAEMREHPMSLRAAGLLGPLTTTAAHQGFGCNTITPADLRGTKSNGDRPITIYVMRTPGGSSPRQVLAAAVQTAVWMAMLSYGPNEKMKSGATSGPRAFMCLIPDIHLLPHMPALAVAADLGRSKKMSIIVTGAAAGAVAIKYGEEAMSAIASCFHMKLALNQSDPQEMPLVDPFGEVGYGHLTTLPLHRGYLLTGARSPLEVRPAFFFEHDWMLKRCFNVRTGLGPLPVNMEVVRRTDPKTGAKYTTMRTVAAR